MGDQNLKDLNPDGASDAVRCLICLDMFSGQPVASPQHCDHFYCLTCITEWTRVRLFLGIQMILPLLILSCYIGVVRVNSWLTIPVELCTLFVCSRTILTDAFLHRLQILAL